MTFPGWMKPLVVVAALVGLGLGAVITTTMDRRHQQLIAALLVLVATGAMYELWLRLRPTRERK